MIIQTTYVIHHTANMCDINRDKMTLLYLKALLKSPVRLHLGLQPWDQSIRYQHYWDMCFDAALFRYNPSSPNFWNTRSLARYLIYAMDNAQHDTNNKRIYIDSGILASGLFEPKNISVMCAQELTGVPTIEQATLECIDFLNNMGIEIYQAECPKYDFSCCYFDPKFKTLITQKIQDIMNKFEQGEQADRELDRNRTNALLSLLCHQIAQENENIQVDTFDMYVAELTPEILEPLNILR